MSVLEVPRQSTAFAFVGAWCVEEALKALPMGTKPRPALLLLAPRLAERRRSYQRLSGVRPPIRVRLPRVVVLQEGGQARLEYRRAGEVAALQETPRHHAEEQLHLVQPRAVLGQ